jgi:hypothetical protein
VRHRSFHLPHRGQSVACRPLSRHRPPDRLYFWFYPAGLHRIRRARAAGAAHGLGARHSPPRTPSIGTRSQFCWVCCGAANLFGQSHRRSNTLSPIAAVRSVTSLPDRRAGLTLLPSATYPPPFPAAVPPCTRRVAREGAASSVATRSFECPAMMPELGRCLCPISATVMLSTGTPRGHRPPSDGLAPACPPWLAPPAGSAR